MNELEINFDSEFESDSDVEEMLDNLITTIENENSIDDSKAAIVNPYRLQQILYTYKMLKYLMREKNAKVAYTLYEPYRSMGSVSVIGSDMVFGNTEWFVKAVELASNFEVYPKTDGTVQMNFTFHGLTKPIE